LTGLDWFSCEISILNQAGNKPKLIVYWNFFDKLFTIWL